MSLADKIKAADDAKHERLEVPEWGVTLELRSTSIEDRAPLIRLFESDDPDRTNVFNTRLLIACAWDPDTGEKAFTDADAEWLVKKNAAVVDRVAKVALRVVGLSDDAEAELGKD